MRFVPSKISAALRPKRRWFQFSLRTLLALTAVFAVGMGILTGRVRQQERAVALVAKLGGQVNYEHEITHGVTVSKMPDRTLCLTTFSYSTSKQPPAPPWMQRLVDKHYFVSVVGIRLSGPEVTDAVLSHVGRLRQLRFLSLCDTRITDRGLVNLEKLTALEVLNLDRTRITDNGMEHLRKLRNLEYVSLEGTSVSDAGLRHLSGMRKLRVLKLGSRRPSGIVDGTNITDLGLEQLKQLTKLEVLSVGGTEVTDAGEKDLCRALPNLTITH